MMWMIVIARDKDSEKSRAKQSSPLEIALPELSSKLGTPRVKAWHALSQSLGDILPKPGIPSPKVWETFSQSQGYPLPKLGRHSPKARETLSQSLGGSPPKPGRPSPKAWEALSQSKEQHVPYFERREAKGGRASRIQYLPCRAKHRRAAAPIARGLLPAKLFVSLQPLKKIV